MDLGEIAIAAAGPVVSRMWAVEAGESEPISWKAVQHLVASGVRSALGERQPSKGENAGPGEIDLDDEHLGPFMETLRSSLTKAERDSMELDEELAHEQGLLEAELEAVCNVLEVRVAPFGCPPTRTWWRGSATGTS